MGCDNPVCGLLACPACGQGLRFSEQRIDCEGCGAEYSVDGKGRFAFIAPQMYSSREDYDFIRSVTEFWGKGWTARSDEHAFLYEMDRDELLAFAEKEVAAYRARKGRGMLWSTEIEAGSLRGKVGLNIGSGTGVEALLMLSQGAESVIALDATREARDSTQKIIDKVGVGIAVQGDARYLPVRDESIDFVYSSGVLHHSSNIERSVREIHRVLKSGGVAYIGLYSKTSISFQRTNLKGLISGKFSKKAIHSHLSAQTEPAWRTENCTNPHTELFGVADCRRLFAGFANVTVRRGQFETPQVPGLRWLKRWENSSLLAHVGNGIYTKAVK